MIWAVLFIIIVQHSTCINSDSFLLPNTIIPYHYKIGLFPDIYEKDPKNFTLYGTTEILATVKAPTRLISVHAVNLTLTNHVRVVRKGTTKDMDVNVFDSIKYNKKFQWFDISLKERLVAGNKIVIQFTKFKRPITHSLIGLYYYTRTSKNNEIQYGVVTQMQTTYARHTFPCFDEPALKATFEMTLYRQQNYIALSNGKLVATKRVIGTKWIKDTFKTTPKMSTYLVAVVITQYEGIGDKIGDVMFTYYYPPNRSPQHLRLAIQVTRQMFPVIEEYFGCKYPTSKLDQIGFAARDYSLGGMENLGLVTYKDMFLYQNLEKPSRDKYIAKLILHELTHQWFGNIVTMKWWDDLWLNEGVTEFFTLLQGRWLDKEYQLRALGLRYVLRGMSLEQESIMLPVYVPWAKTPDEIEQVMNDVTYLKGGMTIKMAELLMGENAFKTALQNYIRKNLFGSVTHQDLWNEFSLVNKANNLHLNMSKVLTPWIMQSGFPLVTVKINYSTNAIDYSQQLFYHKEKDVAAKMPVVNIYNYTWPIPIQWKTERHGLSKISVEFKKKGSVKVPFKMSPEDWLVVNPEGNFYYLVNYEKSHWELIGRHLEKNYRVLDQYTKSQMVYNALCLYAATRKGIGNYIETDTFIKLFKFAQYETESLPIVYLREVLLKDLPELKPITDIMRNRKVFGSKKG